MACLRKGIRGRFLVKLAAVCTAACLIAMSNIPSAWGAASIADRETEPVSIMRVSAEAFGTESSCTADGFDEGIAVSRFCPSALSAVGSPESIEAGIDCGMDWMCGIEPCLCGSSDAWGGCSCNGMETLVPTVAFASSDESVVRVVEAFGTVLLVPMGPGEATLSCTASLRYFSDTTEEVRVIVGDPTSADAVLLGLGLGIVALFAFAVAVTVRVTRKRRISAGKAGKGEGHGNDG